MAKKHLFSAHNDFKTGVLCKFFLILGCILLIVYLVETLLHPVGLSEESTGIILAFTIISIGLALVLLFFSRQFMKLSQIADDVEQDESLVDEEETAEQVSE
jgi:uncharacterized membrane protein